MGGGHVGNQGQMWTHLPPHRPGVWSWVDREAISGKVRLPITIPLSSLPSLSSLSQLEVTIPPSSGPAPALLSLS